MSFFFFLGVHLGPRTANHRERKPEEFRSHTSRELVKETKNEDVKIKIGKKPKTKKRMKRGRGEEDGIKVARWKWMHQATKLKERRLRNKGMK